MHSRGSVRTHGAGPRALVPLLTLLWLLSSGCGYVAIGAILASGGGGGGGGKKTAEVAPVILLPDVVRQVGSVDVDYTLQDGNSDDVTVRVEYSADGGTTFAAATLLATDAGTISGNEILDVPSAPGGVAHMFTWDAATDIGTAANPDVQVRLLPRDSARVGLEVTSSTFIVGNDAPDILLDPTPIPDATGLVAVAFTLYDSTQDFCDVTAEHSTDGGGTFAPVTPAYIRVGSVTNLASDTLAAGGVGHSFAWNTLEELGVTNLPQVSLRLTPVDRSFSEVGTPVVTNDFAVVNNDSPTVFTKPVARQDGIVTVDFVVLDVNDDPVTVDVRFSPDGGVQFFPATIVGTSDGIVTGSRISGLTADAMGVDQWFTWDSGTDLGPAANETVQLRLEPSDASGLGAVFVTGSITVGNDVPTISVVPLSGPHPEGVITLEFTLADTTSDPADLTVEFSTDGGSTWAPAEISVGVLLGTPTAPSPGIVHRLAWNTLNNIGLNNIAAEVRITPCDDPTGALQECGVADGTGSFTVQNNDAPVSFIASPLPGVVVDTNVTISYLLFHANSQDLDITVEASTDDGATWVPAAEETSGASEGTTSLTSSPAGISHIFVWDSRVDVGSTDHSQVRLRVTPTLPGSIGSTMAGPMWLNNNDEPFAFVGAPGGTSGSVGGDVNINYSIGDVESDPVDILAFFSTDGGSTFAAATDAGPVSGSQGTTGLSSGQPPVPHRFIWDSITDGVAILAEEADVIFRIIPSDHADPVLGLGATAQTIEFVVDNTSPPVVNNLTATGSSGSITVTYDLFDAEPPTGPTVDLAVAYSLNGLGYVPATLISTSEGSIDTNTILGVTPSDVAPGAGKSFVWDSDADIGQTNRTGVRLRVIPQDTKVGVGASDTFDVLNNDAPVVLVSGIGVEQSDDVAVNYSLQDSNGDLLDVTVEVQAGGAGWLPATAAPSSPPTTSRASGPAGQEVGHLFVWDSFADLSSQYFTDVQLRFSATDPFATGPTTTSVVFTIDNRIPADLVLGHDTFFEGAVDGRGLKFSSRGGLAFDGTKLSIMDYANNRILIYNSLPASDFQTADVVLGQPSFFLNIGSNGGVTASSLRVGCGLYTDGTALYACDSDHNRVLVWDSWPTANFAPADHVLGQSSFTSSGSTPISAGKMKWIHGVHGNGSQLFVADTYYNRVLVWDLPIDYVTPPPPGQGPPADYVIGQPDFVSEQPNQGLPVGARTLNRPWDVYATASRLFVADQQNHRVLEFGLPIAASDPAAVRVLGQPNMSGSTPNNGGPSGATMNSPRGVSGDASHTIVADASNHRVLIWNTATPAGSSAANVVVGQSNFTDGSQFAGGAGPDDLGLWFPMRAISAGGQLVIIDGSNHRVVVHDGMPTANGELADVVIGQRNFFENKENHATVDGRSMRWPSGLDTDGNRLFVADYLNNRVLGWNSIPALNNKNADLVFGQPDFVTDSGNVGPDRLNIPQDVEYDPAGGRLFVADFQNNRVVIYDEPFSVGMAASVFIGQDNGSGSVSDAQQNRMWRPRGISFDGNYLWVADSWNHRVLAFAEPFVDAMNASILLGQAGWTDRTENHGGSDPEYDQSVYFPQDLHSTGTELFVADQFNSRVMVWTLPAGIDATADRVVGQSSFANRVQGLGRDRLAYPAGVWSDGTRLVVTDGNNMRVLIWDNLPPTFGPPADRIIGQPTFGTWAPNYEGVTEFGMWPAGPTCTGPAVVNGPTTDLWMPDTGNYRVLRIPID